MNMPVFPDIRKIACLRATALGDFIAAVPALHALRAAYPDAEIVYLGNPWHRQFLESRPSPVDRAVVIPVSKGVRVEPGKTPDPLELEVFFDEMRQERFDLAIQMHGGGRNSNPFLLRLGARHSVGMRTPDAPELERWMPYELLQNEFARLLELMTLAGAPLGSFQPEIAVTAGDQTELRRAHPSLTRYVVLHPGASDPRRRWPPERFARVGDVLAGQGFQVVITGVPSERELVEHVLTVMRCDGINACGTLSIGGLAALLSRASLVISNDTGPLHLADAVGAPTVGIFWCANYLNWQHLTRRRHQPLASWMIRCPLCGEDMTTAQPVEGEWLGECTHDTCFVAGVTENDVLDAALRMLGRMPALAT